MTAAKDQGSPSSAPADVERMREALEKIVMTFEMHDSADVMYAIARAALLSLTRGGEFVTAKDLHDLRSAKTALPMEQKRHAKARRRIHELERLLSLTRGEGEQVTLRKRPIAWMRYVCGTSQFRHASDEGDPPEEEGWIALYRRGEGSSAAGAGVDLPPGRTKQDVVNLVDLALSDSLVQLDDDDASRFDYDIFVRMLAGNSLCIRAIKQEGVDEALPERSEAPLPLPPVDRRSE